LNASKQTENLSNFLFEEAQNKIKIATNFFFPKSSVQVKRNIGSVTNYVCELIVNETELFGKYSFLGISQASLLNNLTCDELKNLLELQNQYLENGKIGLLHEFKALKFFQKNLPAYFSEHVLYKNGVLLSSKLSGTNLQDLFFVDSIDMVQVFKNLFYALQSIHSLSQNYLGYVSKTFSIDTSSSDTLEKFKSNFFNKSNLIARIQSFSIPPDEISYFLDAYSNMVEVMRPFILKFNNLPRDCIIYGDYKPENIIISSNFSSEDEYKVGLIDPDLHLGRQSLDIARLISRTSFFFLYSGVSEDIKRNVREGLNSFVKLYKSKYSVNDEEIILVATMDLMNIMSTYLKLKSSKNFSNNVVHNFQNRFFIFAIFKELFDFKTGTQKVINVDKFIDLFYFNLESS
jgi:hypothetical protein